MGSPKEREIISEDFSINKRSTMNPEYAFDDTFSLPKGFSSLGRIILRDLNGNNSTPTLKKYSKDDISKYLQNPANNEKALRDACLYIYGASSHFRRLIQYFSSLSDLSYVVAPYKIDTSKATPSTVKRNYHQVLNLLSSMDIKNQFAKVLTVCLREDTFYGTMWVTSDSIIIQQLPSDYCKIAVVEDNVFNVSFDFSYFDMYSQNLELYPEEFRIKYDIYKKDKAHPKWQELDSPTSFAIKCNSDIATYSLPPFAGLLREIYDIEDYKGLKLTKEELQNYALLVMKLGIDNNGNWSMDYGKAKQFWQNLDGVLPDEVGSILSPMDIEKISFERSHTGDTDSVAEAEQSLFTAAGVQSLLFNNAKASANALLLSIKVDQELTYGIVKSITGVLNRFIHAQSYGKNFSVDILDCSWVNRKEVGDTYIKAFQFGIPSITYYAASQGISQDTLDGMNFLENDVLNFRERFKPLQSSATLSANSENDEGGRPTKEIDELSDAGEQTREDQ